MTDEPSTVDKLVALVGVTSGLIAIIAWHIHVAYPEPTDPMNILESGLVVIVAYGISMAGLMLAHRVYTNHKAGDT